MLGLLLALPPGTTSVPPRPAVTAIVDDASRDRRHIRLRYRRDNREWLRERLWP